MRIRQALLPLPALLQIWHCASLEGKLMMSHMRRLIHNMQQGLCLGRRLAMGLVLLCLLAVNVLAGQSLAKIPLGYGSDSLVLRSDSLADLDRDSDLAPLRFLQARTAIMEQILLSYKASVDIEAQQVLPLVKAQEEARKPSCARLSYQFRLGNQVDSLRIEQFESPQRERPLKIDLAAANMIVANSYAPSFSFSGLQSFLNPLRAESAAMYRYQLDSLVKDQAGHTQYYYSYRSLTGLAWGQIQLESPAALLRRFSMHVYMKGVYREGFDLRYGEVAPAIYLPLEARYSVKHSSLFKREAQEYLARFAYSELRVDSAISQLDHIYEQVEMPELKLLQKKLPSILALHRAFDSEPWRLPNAPAPISFRTNSQALGRKDSTSYWRRILINREGILAERVPWWDAALWGHEYKLPRSWSIGNEGLIWSAFYYNYADSFWLGQRFTVRKRFAPGRQLEISTGLYYLLRRRCPAWVLRTRLYYSPSRRGLLELDAGHRSYDLSDARERSDQVTDMLMALLDGQGPTTRFDDKYISLSNRIQLNEHFELFTSLMLADRKPLPHGTAWSILGFSMAEVLSFSHASEQIERYIPPHRLFEVKARLSYNPRPYYRYNSQGYKEAVDEGVSAPLIALTYRGALGMGRKSDARFHHLDLSLHQSIKLGAARSIYYQVNVGGYLDRSQLYPSEYFFLKGSNAFWRFDYSLESSFQTLPPYTATERYHLILQSSYKAPRILVNFLPILWLRSNEETLHLKCRWDIDNTKPYIELGYSQGIGTLLRVGFFYGAYNLIYDKGMAIRFTFNM